MPPNFNPKAKRESYASYLSDLPYRKECVFFPHHAVPHHTHAKFNALTTPRIMNRSLQSHSQTTTLPLLSHLIISPDCWRFGSLSFLNLTSPPLNAFPFTAHFQSLYLDSPHAHRIFQPLRACHTTSIRPLLWNQL